LVIAVDANTGRCDLSAPLSHEVPTGKLALADLKYHPFSGTVLEDGTSNPFAEETVNGWRAYVATVCQTVKEDHGTEGRPDAGFDLEVWNEYTFCSDFLDERCYYDPARKFKADVSYQNRGLTCSGHEIILPITVDYVNDPANDLPGVHVISGFFQSTSLGKRCIHVARANRIQPALLHQFGSFGTLLRNLGIALAHHK
jgi:hypothetical protein